MSSNYKTRASSADDYQDLDDLFEPIGDRTPISGTGLKASNGKDLSELYAPVNEGEEIGFDTGFKSSNYGGHDLRKIFAKKGSIVTPGFPPGVEPDFVKPKPVASMIISTCR